MVATTLLRAADAGDSTLAPAALDAALVAARDDATAAGRVVDPLLNEKRFRRRLLEDAIRAAERRGVLAIDGSRSVTLEPAVLREDSVIARLAAEHAAVGREMAHGPPMLAPIN